MLFGKQKKRDKELEDKYNIAMEESLKLQSTVNALNFEIGSLIATIQEKDKIIKHKDEIIKQKDDIIKQQSQTILSLETSMQSGVVMVDKHTKLYNVDYFKEFLLPKLDNTYYILIIQLVDYDSNYDNYYRQDISNIIKKFTINSDMTPILWNENTIHIYMKVERSKIQKLKDEVVNLFVSYIDKKEIYLTFEQFDLDKLDIPETSV